MAKEKTFWEDSAVKNNSTYAQYLYRLMELSVSMFDWSGLPDTVDPRFMEMVLFSNGHALFFKNDVDDYICLQAALGGQLDIYRIPTRRHAYAANGFQKTCSPENSVIIWNNYLHRNSYLDVLMYAQRLYELDRIIDVNVRAQKTPVLILANETQRLTLKNVYMKYDGNEPVIFGDKNLDLNAVKALNTEAPYMADKLFALKSQYWNEALTLLGISNTNYQKRERMTTDEVLDNQGGTIASRYSRLNARQEACEKINKMFGLDIWCEYRQDNSQLFDELMYSDGKGREKTVKKEVEE